MVDFGVESFSGLLCFPQSPELNCLGTRLTFFAYHVMLASPKLLVMFLELAISEA